MPPLREVRNRIKSVKNISQITRALEAVSASRVRRAQARTLASRAYAQKAWEILINVQNASTGEVSHPLLTERTEIKNVLVVLITSDRGLAGSYNSNVIRVADRFAERLGKPVQYVPVGRKGRDSLIRAGENVIAEFSDLPAEPKIADIAPIARLAIDAYLGGDVDEVYIAYTDFVNMLAQRPTVLPWLPLTTHEDARRVAGEFVKEVPRVTTGSLIYEYEPSAAAVLNEIVPRFTELQLYQALLEAQASEHAARMAAMRNATDNATQLVADLTLEYNKARQASITAEILDIVGGANALQNAIDAATDSIMIGDTAVVPSRVATAVAVSAPVAVATVAAPTATASAPAPAPKSSRKSKASSGDDLTQIEGIGPKMAAALQSAQIDTFAKLAQADEASLRQAIEAGGMKFSPSLTTWAKQAQFLVDGDVEGLKVYQSQLSGGRETH
jgi:F-type H+-transporting ATPase subunit gamma